MMDGVTIHQLLCLDAVVTEGSFQAAAASHAADRLNVGQESGNPTAAHLAGPQRLPRDPDRGRAFVSPALTGAARRIAEAAPSCRAAQDGRRERAQGGDR